ncbi:6-phospho-3-hexuloisomerase [Aerococcus urinae]|uniref:SIS domain-containing protein n=1 Tax=Aerococcus urinae TaxID=1376 RepID=A0A109RG62_9LACT|nr:6-phospho-3-hexuloisomerase [Aerococcus urinae]AMB96446.1 sugar isomerase [Aerococcus urinae]MCY3032181.1 SIS domain-containing protein [Aerococcus urinae]MCY3037687.1 SIS domain-containing protein [Aerococcus urinae]MCY3044227.1 SIS domain-containing protein [Aerococcus urinae]MCY3045648.1 SIS domain-containing protein [Aerococcus urinae]
MGIDKASKAIIKEISNTFSLINGDEVEQLIDLIKKADKVFFIGVGRVLLSLEAVAKRWSHLGINCVVVGEITEPAITDKDLLIVGSGSGESLIPVEIAKKAKIYKAKVVHIGSNINSTISSLSDLIVRIPVRSKLNLSDEIVSIQPMTSLFEQCLYILGDAISLMLVEEENIDIESLWEYHANLE